MATVVLTDLTVRRLKPPEKGQITYWDETTPGFGVRVSQGGSKTFIAMNGAHRKRHTLGRYPNKPLAEARGEAKTILNEPPPKKEATMSFKDGVALYLSSHCEQNCRESTTKEVKRLLTKHFQETLGNTSIQDITTQDIVGIIDRLVVDTPSEANHAFIMARAFFRWTVKRRYIEHSPLEGLPLPAKKVVKDRVLTDAELKAIWKACDGTFGDIVKLLMLTGQRRGEISALRAEYLNRKKHTITLPPTLTKNGRKHTLPYGTMAAKILKELAKEGFLFPRRGEPDKSFCGWSKAKLAFDKRCKIEPWTLHDLRRTFTTNLAKLGIAPHVLEKLLNHSGGTISGVAAIYNQFQYQAEMRQAALAWEKYLSSVLKRR